MSDNRGICNIYNGIFSHIVALLWLERTSKGQCQDMRTNERTEGRQCGDELEAEQRLASNKQGIWAIWDTGYHHTWYPAYVHGHPCALKVAICDPRIRYRKIMIIRWKWLCCMHDHGPLMISMDRMKCGRIYIRNEIIFIFAEKSLSFQNCVEKLSSSIQEMNYRQVNCSRWWRETGTERQCRTDTIDGCHCDCDIR